jgi:ABC-type multidrug transport system fused ATPase/permease subunit
MQGSDMNAVMWVWGATLAIIALVIVPVAVTLLRRASSASRNIAYYAQEMLDAGGSIASHTANIQALNATLQTAGTLVTVSEGIGGAAGRIHGALTAPSSTS